MYTLKQLRFVEHILPMPSYYRKSRRQMLFQSAAVTFLTLPKFLATNWQVPLCRSVLLLPWTNVMMRFVSKSLKHVQRKNTNSVSSGRLFLNGPFTCIEQLDTYLLAPVTINLKIGSPTLFLSIYILKRLLPKLRVRSLRSSQIAPSCFHLHCANFIPAHSKFKGLFTSYNIPILTPNCFSSKSALEATFRRNFSRNSQ